MVECCNQSLTGCSSRSLEDTSTEAEDSGGLVQEVSDGEEKITLKSGLEAIHVRFWQRIWLFSAHALRIYLMLNKKKIISLVEEISIQYYL